MIKSIYILIAIVTLAIKTTGQTVYVNLKIVDDSSRAVAFATIENLTSRKIQFSNKDGEFRDNFKINDEVKITSVGFKDTIILITQISSTSIVQMKRNQIFLPDIVVGRKKIATFGNINSKLGRSTYPLSMKSSFFEISKKINVDTLGSSFRILKIRFKQKKFCNKTPIFIKFYEIGDDGLPGREILLDAPISVLENQYSTGIYSIKLDSRKIYPGTDVFYVSILFIKPFDFVGLCEGDYGITETKREVEQRTFRRSEVFNRRWYSEYENGIEIPAQLGYKKDQSFIGKSESLSHPINLVMDIDIEFFDE